jgi:galactitol-specific phosphotransferase system IIB component
MSNRLWGRFVVGLAVAVAAGLIAFSCPAARAETAEFANGATPADSYAGCVDTWISEEPYEGNRDEGRSAVLRTGGKRAALIRFDLSAIPAGAEVRQAVLRIADAGYPRPGKDGEFPSTLKAFVLTRAWDANANWLKHRRTDYKVKDAGNWETPGGDIDTTTDFGQAEKGMVAADRLVPSQGGHVHELDVTAAVKAWLAKPAASFGLLLRGGRSELASADWPVAAWRPRLIVSHGAGAAAIPALPAGPGKTIARDPIAETPDAGKAAGDYSLVRVGLQAACTLRGASTSAYVKENVEQFPGTWGWMTQCRVGGVAGDFSRTLLYFDLAGIAKDASVEQAKLVCSLVPQTARQIQNYRYGAFLVHLPDPPGWSADEVTPGERKAGAAWAGSPLACTGDKPLAIGTVVEQKVEVRGERRNRPMVIEFYLTGAVRAWVSGKTSNCGVMLDNRIEGGAYDIYSARAFQAELRPYLEISISPAPKEDPPPPAATQPAPLPADYWVPAMRQAHQRFRGKPGTLAQYGDSITVTMAYLANYGWSKKINPKNMSPAAAADAATVEKYADLELWRKWKEAEWGNTGMMKSDWLFHNVDRWQKKMVPETAVIMFGTNDIGGLWPPEYTENMAASLRRMLADGTVPMLTSIPPAARDGHYEYWLAARSIAAGLKVPLIDYYAEILRRRPDDWNGRLPKFATAGKKDEYAVPTLVSGDGTHPSNPKQFAGDWSEEALSSSGYGLRDYMTIRMYAEVIRKVYQAGGETGQKR